MTRTATATSWIGIALLTLAFTALHAQTPLPQGARYVEREFRLPVPGSGSQGLDAMEVYVNTPGRHPLALITHGTSNSAEVRKELTPQGYLPQARWFAERGYVALIIIRRGYGTSGGQEDGTNGGCGPGGSFERTGEAAADDLRNAVVYAQRQMPEVDTSQVISTGVSTGGFTQVALDANPPPGLKAAISFAGGRGGDGEGNLCNESGFESALHSFGTRSHTPMLWIYAENDKWFPPYYARRFLAAFQSGGGRAQFVLAPPDGSDGHGLFGHVAAWSATVQQYLSERNLLPVNPPYTAQPLPNVPAPAGLGPTGKAAFETYLGLGPKKAFATNGASWYGYASGQPTQALADREALNRCNTVRKSGGACFIATRGDAASNASPEGIDSSPYDPPQSGRPQSGGSVTQDPEVQGTVPTGNGASPH
jgi:dienelactone hydrolase